MKNIVIIIGTRPNFIKVTQFKKQVRKFPDLNITIVHTGQHYDASMTDVFFDQLELIPDHFLNITPGSPNRQTGEIMIRLEELFNEIGKPDLVMVVGDVNSTLAGALAAYKMGIPLAHLESGLRSFDRSMPEEINRIITDEITDYFFITEQSGFDNLIKEGKKEESIFFVGNTMIDTLVAFSEKIAQNDILNKLNLSEESYILMTMHRPATVDNKAGLEKLFGIIKEITRNLKLVFPIHPRTLKNIRNFGLNNYLEEIENLIIIEPQDYITFQKLISSSKMIITDSGGIQEEATYLQKPCLTLRPNTERPITVEIGSNELITFDIEVISEYVRKVENNGKFKDSAVPKLWDGEATYRVLSVLNGKI